MKCECALKKITNYIKRELSEKEEWEFIRHMETCPQCFDELEFTFIMLEGLDMLDEGKMSSIDFVMEIHNEMELRKKNIRSKRRRLNLIFWGSVLVFVVAVTLLMLPFVLNK